MNYLSMSMLEFRSEQRKDLRQIASTCLTVVCQSVWTHSQARHQNKMASAAPELSTDPLVSQPPGLGGVCRPDEAGGLGSQGSSQ
jgi:hypothetical protein